MRIVMRDEADPLAIESRQGRAQKTRSALDEQRPQPLPGAREHVRRRYVAARGVVRVRHGVEILGVDAGMLEAPARRANRKLPGGEGHGLLAVLASAEALLLGRGQDAPSTD